MKALSGLACLPLVLLAAAGPDGATRPELLTPRLHAGDRLEAIFGKTVAITGADFDPVVHRVSGTTSDRITRADAATIEEAEAYTYDGMAQGNDIVSVRDGGRTNCVDGKCAPNTSTSAPTFNPLLWGAVPHDAHAGTAWDVTIDRPWEIGPPGSERVTITRWDAAPGLVTMTRAGSGKGLSEDDRRSSTLTIVSKGQPITVTMTPGPAHWQGKATFLHGVTLADEIVVTRPVTLTAQDGRTFAANERIYTLYQEA